MNDFKFFLCQCFSEGTTEDPSYLENVVKSFIKRYLKTWANIMEKDSRDFSWKDHSEKIFDLFGNFNWIKIFDEVKSGKNKVDIPIKANGSKIRIKRFGNILAFNILNLKNEEKKHINGLKSVENLCRADDPNNNQGVYEIIDKIEVIFSINGKRERNENTGKVFDFNLIFKKIKIALPWVNWSLNAKNLIDSYLLNRDDKHTIVGQYCGFNILGKLIHKDEQKGIQYSNIQIWRAGNVKNTDKGKYQFKAGDDIQFKLSLVSSLPDSIFENSNTKSDFHSEQFKLAEAGAIFIAQLCAMQLNKYRESRIQIGD
jgi:hypothetical protein